MHLLWNWPLGQPLPTAPQLELGVCAEAGMVKSLLQHYMFLKPSQVMSSVTLLPPTPWYLCTGACLGSMPETHYHQVLLPSTLGHGATAELAPSSRDT